MQHLAARRLENEMMMASIMHALTPAVDPEVGPELAMFLRPPLNVLEGKAQELYADGCKMLVQALLCNGKHLRKTWPGKYEGLTELIAMSPKQLREGGSVDAEYKEFNASEAYARQLLEERGPKATSGIFACPRCNSYDVSTELKQTRSADEPMDCFCVCEACHLRFKR